MQLLFEGGYYLFHQVPGAATIRGAASIRINTVFRVLTTQDAKPKLICYGMMGAAIAQ